MAKKLRVGIIGAGSIAKARHIPGYAADKNCILVALADPEKKCRDAIREKWAFEREYSDYPTMLAEEKLDLVSVCTPNKFHAAAAIAALESGADVFLEKPIAVSLEEGLAIQAAVERTGRRLAVCFTHRFIDLIKAAKKGLELGLIGKLYMVRVRFAHSGPFPGWASTDWFYNPELAGGGAMLDMGIHAVDLVHYLVGPITRVSAEIATLRKPIAVDDNAVLVLQVGASCLGYIEVGWTSKSGFSGVELMGDNGSIIADYSRGTTVVRSGVTKPDGTITMKEKTLSGVVRKSDSQMADLLRQLRTGKSFTADIGDGVAALKVALAGYEASRLGRRVDI